MYNCISFNIINHQLYDIKYGFYSKCIIEFLKNSVVEVLIFQQKKKKTFCLSKCFKAENVL